MEVFTEQIVVGDADRDIVGVALTVKEIVFVLEHPDEVPVTV